MKVIVVDLPKCVDVSLIQFSNLPCSISFDFPGLISGSAVPVTVSIEFIFDACGLWKININVKNGFIELKGKVKLQAPFPIPKRKSGFRRFLKNIESVKVTHLIQRKNYFKHCLIMTFQKDLLKLAAYLLETQE